MRNRRTLMPDEFVSRTGGPRGMPLMQQVGIEKERFQIIQWAPLAKPVRLPFNGTNYHAVKKALTDTFGSMPIRLHAGEHLQVIVGMKHAAGDGYAPYEILENGL